MKRQALFLKTLLLGILCALALPACDDALVGPELRTVDPPPDVGVASTAVVYRLGDPPEVVDGAHSELAHTTHGLTARFSTHGLEPGEIYALWARVYSAPEQCTDGAMGEARCGPADAGRVWYLCGTVAATEHLAFVCRLDPDDAVDHEAAEIHLILRAYGPAPPGGEDVSLAAQDTRCASPSCEEVQAAVHAGV